jgi:hypothetical protein
MKRRYCSIIATVALAAAGMAELAAQERPA